MNPKRKRSDSHLKYQGKVLIFTQVDGRYTGNFLSMEIIGKDEFDFLNEMNPSFYIHNGKSECKAPWISTEHWHYQVRAAFEEDPEKIQQLKSLVPDFFFGCTVESFMDEHYDVLRRWCRLQGRDDPEGIKFEKRDDSEEPLSPMTLTEIQAVMIETRPENSSK